MAIVTNYICDVSGKSSTDKRNFIDVIVTAKADPSGYCYGAHTMTISKLIHKETAAKLKLLPIDRGDKEDETIPTPTFESQIATLLRDFVQELAYESGGEAAAEYMHRHG